MIETANLKEAEKAVERDEVLAPGEVVMKQKIPNGHTGLLVWAQGNLRLDDRAKESKFCNDYVETVWLKKVSF